jgi:hypothetical protein
MDISYILSVLINFLGAFLLIITYTYIDKLERTKCQCSEHKYRKYIKGYAIFAIFFIIFTMFMPPHMAARNFGPLFGLIYLLVIVAFCIATVIFFVYTIIYVRYLTKNKCKCSEDARREIIFIWSIIEIACLSALVILPLLLGVIGGTYFLTVSVMKDVDSKNDTLMSVLLNPVKATMALPKAIKNIPSSSKKAFRKFRR